MAYPVLVEQMYFVMRRQGINASKDKIFRDMIAANMIDENGQPTQTAMDNGWIDQQGSKVTEQASLAAFKQANPMYAPFADSHFTRTAKGWGIDGYVFHTLVNEALNSPMATDEVKEMAHIVLKEAKKMERQ
ncbi:hypothetical protein [Secundilactobacillus silagei]|nr:hypothetical protein [Secundilactobacillus silagei]